jgi:ABC-type transport system involved in Fe-S cluster assembly fused permease/ATPase subunit
MFIGTSALDSETEQRMMAAIHEEQERTGMTTMYVHLALFVVHADSMTSQFDSTSSLVDPERR